MLPEVLGDPGSSRSFVTPDTFDIEYVSKTELNLEQIQKIEAAIALYLETGLVFTFIRKEKLERSKSGKLKQFVSLI